MGSKVRTEPSRMRIPDRFTVHETRVCSEVNLVLVSLSTRIILFFAVATLTVIQVDTDRSSSDITLVY